MMIMDMLMVMTTTIAVVMVMAASIPGMTHRCFFSQTALVVEVDVGTTLQSLDFLLERFYSTEAGRNAG